MSKCKIIALNYIYWGKHHGGGKDQVALNLLQGFVSNGDIGHFVVFCFDYSVEVIRKIAPDIKIEVIKSCRRTNELSRLCHITWVNTFVLPGLIKKYNVDVVFHAGYANGARKLKATAITLPHDIKAISHRVIGMIKVPMYKYLLYKVMYRMDFMHADKVVAISDMDLHELQHYYPEYKEKFVRIYNPIKVDFLETYVPKSKQSGILAINIQFHHKNIITLIKAYEKIMNQIDDQLILIGVLPSRVQYLKKYVEEHKLGERVIFTGFISGSQKQKLLRDCSLYVNPSLFEGFGMTAVEAIILKVPTLLAKVSANYEVTKGLCNYYEPADSHDALADAIIRTLEHKATQAELEQKSLDMVNAYDYRKIANEYQKLFADV